MVGHLQYHSSVVSLVDKAVNRDDRYTVWQRRHKPPYFGVRGYYVSRLASTPSTRQVYHGLELGYKESIFSGGGVGMPPTHFILIKGSGKAGKNFCEFLPVSASPFEKRH